MGKTPFKLLRKRSDGWLLIIIGFIFTVLGQMLLMDGPIPMGISIFGILLIAAGVLHLVRSPK